MFESIIITNAAASNILFEAGEWTPEGGDAYNKLVQRRAASDASAIADERYEADWADFDDLWKKVANGEATDDDEYAFYDMKRVWRTSHAGEYMPDGWDEHDYIPEWERV